MLIVSLIGNLLGTIVSLSQAHNFEQNFSKYTDDCFIFYRIRQSLNLMSHYLMFFPYFLRAYRLALIFQIDQNWDRQDLYFNKYLYRTDQKWLIRVLGIGLIPFIILSGVILMWCDAAFYLPASEVSEDRVYSQSLYIFFCFLEQLLFIYAIYSLREISDDYNMSKEMTIAMMLWFITPIFSVFPTDLERYSQLPGLTRNLLLFFCSYIYPIWSSYSSKVIPEVITLEMLDSLELILESKVPLDCFERYLKQYSGTANESICYSSGYETLQLYMKCESHLNLPQNSNKEELINELLKYQTIGVDYFYDSKDSFEAMIQKSKQELLAQLKSDFFTGFKKSSSYKNLKRAVNRQEIYIGRLLNLGLNIINPQD
jgi:succinate dehydrogenase hydrophobic anchor subunit